MNSTTQLSDQQTQEDEIDLIALLGILLDHKWLIAAITAFFLFSSICYVLVATPVYQATAMVQIEPKKGGIAGLEEMSELFGQPSQAVTEIEIMKSRLIIGKAVDKLHLDMKVSPDYFPVIGHTIARRFTPTTPDEVAAPWLGLNSYDWGGASIMVSRLEVPNSLLNTPLVLTTGESGGFTLESDEGIRLEGKVGTPAEGQGVTIEITALHANPGTRFNLLKFNRLSTIIEYQKALQASEKGKQSGMIGLALENSDPEFSKLILNEIANLYVQQNVERMSAEAASSLEFLRQQLPQLRQEMEKAEDKLNRYQISAKSANITIETQAVLDQLVELETSLSDLRLRQVEMDKKFTASHPAYQALLNQISSLETGKKRLEQKITNLPETQQELLKLSRDVKVSSEIYTLLLQKAQELDIARASMVGNARVIDTAEVDTTNPVAPKKMLIVIAGTLLGGILSIVIVLVYSMLHRGVENPADIEAIPLPVYATVPFSSIQAEAYQKCNGSNGGHLPLLASEYPTDPSVEAIRSLHTSLHFAMLESSNNIVMFSGPGPGVGKSFISVNLAALMAKTGKRVLLIDGDMRKGYLHKFFQISKATKGLSTVLSKQGELEPNIFQTSVEGLDFLARGPIPPNPSELLLSKFFTALMQRLSERYDMVIIDTPPILAVSDAITISKVSGANFIVTRFGKTPINEIRATIRRFDQNGIHLRGCILNATVQKQLSYLRYGYENYQYRYESDKEETT